MQNPLHDVIFLMTTTWLSSTFPRKVSELSLAKFVIMKIGFSAFKLCNFDILHELVDFNEPSWKYFMQILKKINRKNIFLLFFIMMKCSSVDDHWAMNKLRDERLQF